MSEYKSIVGGALKLKGGVSLVKKEKKSKKRKQREEKGEEEDGEKGEEYIPIIQNGEGRIISSGTTVTGAYQDTLMSLSLLYINFFHS
jgi:hypothetical protein